MSEPIPQTLHMYWRWGTRDACGGQMYYPLPEGWDGGFFCKKLALRAASPTQVGHAGHGSPSLARPVLGDGRSGAQWTRLRHGPGALVRRGGVDMNPGEGSDMLVRM